MGRCGWESSDRFLVDFLLLHSHKSKHLVLFSTSSTFPFTHYFLCCRLILPSTLNFILSVAITLSPFPSLPSLGSSVVAAVLRTDPLCTPHPQGEAGKVIQEGHPCLCCLWVRCHHSSGRVPFYRLLRHPNKSRVLGFSLQDGKSAVAETRAHQRSSLCSSSSSCGAKGWWGSSCWSQ